MHVVLLRLALALYSVGFAHSVLTALHKSKHCFRRLWPRFRWALRCVASIVLRARGLSSADATIQALFSSSAHWRLWVSDRLRSAYRIAPLSVFAFPLIFLMTFRREPLFDPSRRSRMSCAAIGFTFTRRSCFLGAALFILSPGQSCT